MLLFCIRFFFPCMLCILCDGAFYHCIGISSRQSIVASICESPTGNFGVWEQLWRVCQSSWRWPRWSGSSNLPWCCPRIAKGESGPQNPFEEGRPSNQRLENSWEEEGWSQESSQGPTIFQTLRLEIIPQVSAYLALFVHVLVAWSVKKIPCISASDTIWFLGEQKEFIFSDFVFHLEVCWTLNCSS